MIHINTQGQSHGELLEGPLLYQKYKENARKSALRIPLDQKKINSENLTVDKSSISSHGSNGSHLHQSHQAHDEGVKLGWPFVGIISSIELKNFF